VFFGIGYVLMAVEVSIKLIVNSIIKFYLQHKCISFHIFGVLGFWGFGVLGL
jgi:hypothetical protein